MNELAPTCIEPECIRPAVGRGLCRRHWQKARYQGRLDEYPKMHRIREGSKCPKGHDRTPENTVYGKKGKSCRACQRETAAKWRQEAKRVVHEHYGNVCTCCGETEQAFLCIDHVNNDGSEHRRTNPKAANSIFRYLISHDFPEGFQLLCFNCNMAKSFYGQCVHVEPKTGRSLRDLINYHERAATRRVAVSAAL